ncbi:MAG: endopeptidase [Gemmatimonadetes bacterium]|jgi:murein DD-endopeptidase MepM/ murein hydrolase activator NlpD|nr:endopeptidase [Gemmatimonadota bacterium]
MRLHPVLPLVLTLLAGACTRQLAVAPRPAPAAASTAPRVVLAGSALGRTSVSGIETLDYLVARGMTIPVAGIPLGRLQDTFDEGRSSGRVHRALDISAPRGTPVLAADSGRILRMGANSLGGNIIYAADPLGRVVYYYAHLDAYHPGLVQGAVIARGDTLGFVGTSGNAPKNVPHLHFQVMRMPPDGKYWDGEPINPYPLFLLRGTEPGRSRDGAVSRKALHRNTTPRAGQSGYGEGTYSPG